MAKGEIKPFWATKQHDLRKLWILFDKFVIYINYFAQFPHVPITPRPPPPPPTQYYLGYAYACSLPLKAPPYLRTDKISEPPFRGLFAGFSCLGDPPLNPKHCSMYPPYILFYYPLFKFLTHPKREREKKKPPPF